MSKKILRIVSPLILFICTVFLAIYYSHTGYSNTEATILGKMIKDMTRNYRMYQIVATTILYFVGYVVVFPLCKQMGRGYAYVLAMPTGNAMWGTISALLLFLNIPYNKYTMSTVVCICVGAMAYLYREEYRHLKWINILGVLSVVVSISILAASGFFAIFTSSDSYYFVMQYGELIAKAGRLSSDIVGTYMTWTGIMPALSSAFATMWGFENIYAIHYLLIYSMCGFIVLTIYNQTTKYYSRGIAGCIAVITAITVIIIPGISYLSFWIIGNSYFMVYMLLVVFLPYIVQNENPGTEVFFLISLYILWLTLCRAETAVTMSFFVICISALGLTKRQMAFIYLPMCVFQTLFFFTIFYQTQIGKKQADSKLLTTMTMIIIILALLVVAGYILLYDFPPVRFVRQHMDIFGITILAVAGLGIGVLEWEKFKNNIEVVLSNIGDWYWNYVPVAILCIEIIKTYLKYRDRYFDIIVWGFVLLNFVICMGRPQYLRLGIGDSYNRICMSILPVYLVSSAYTFIEYFGAYRKRVIDEKERNYEKSIF